MPSMAEKTKLGKAHSKNQGIKTAVPWSIVKDWDLEPGDYLIWERRAINNEIVVVVRKEKGR
jgi:hypothetical protein